jgi:hypothetical protein
VTILWQKSPLPPQKCRNFKWVVVHNRTRLRGNATLFIKRSTARRIGCGLLAERAALFHRTLHDRFARLGRLLIFVRTARQSLGDSAQEAKSTRLFSSLRGNWLSALLHFGADNRRKILDARHARLGNLGRHLRLDQALDGNRLRRTYRFWRSSRAE